MNITLTILAILPLQQHEIKAEADILLVAEAPLLANPVCLEVGPNFEIFVAETYRQETHGVPDNRAFPEWLDDDLRIKTVAEREEMYRKHHPELIEAWTTNEDRIMLLRDIDGDYVADQSTIFADGFDGLLMGTGAGVFYLDGDVYYTCIPDLWLLRDEDGDDKSDYRENLQTGFGVRVAFRGHDMHGLTRGPFGRIYWSIGDRGYNITTKEGVSYAEPGRGAVFRCWPDGSELEVFSTGLRNPQELAFDDYGNLFTVDNNCDAGDRARLVYLYKGSDSGWRMNFQYLPDRGPWMNEEWWDASSTMHPEFLNSPLANIAAGPSGLCYYPGVGMGPGYEGSFFLADFRGGAEYSGIVRFTVKPDGAGFAFDSEENFWWKVLATDVCFAPDGSMYLSDWVRGWVGDGVGNIFRANFADADVAAQQLSASLLASDFSELRIETLMNLLMNRDKRIRERAQFELVERGAVPQLHSFAIDSSNSTIARTHALWALASLSRINQKSLLPATCINDKDAELRAQFLRSAAEVHFPQMREWFINGLSDESPRVQYFAALGLSHYDDCHDELYALASTNDRFVKSALAESIAAQYSADKIIEFSEQHDSDQRLLSVLALRLQKSEGLSYFLNDKDNKIADEAVLAIYDNAIVAVKNEIAKLALDHSRFSNASIRRILACKNFVGSAEYAKQLFNYAKNPMHPDYLLREVATYLEKWQQPHGFDMILNEWQEFSQRDGDATAQLDLDFSSILEAGPMVRGRKLFSENTILGCTKCHSLEGVTPDGFINPAGPDLTGVGSRLSAEEIEKLIAEPSLVSAMPKDFAEKMTSAELKDLVEFLAQQKSKQVSLKLSDEINIDFEEIIKADGTQLYVSTTEISWDVYDLYFLRDDEKIEVDGITGPSHSVFPVTRGYGHDSMPAIGMTYSAAKNFCKWLSQTSGHQFRLPTSGEWLLALGDETPDSNNAWLQENSDSTPHLVGQHAANSNGLFDMIGNVEEWVVDDSAPKGMTMGGSFLDSSESLKGTLQDTYKVSWQARDPQWPKSSWWMSDAGFVGFRIVSDTNPVP